MKNLKNNKATICRFNNCVTVYGKTAKTVENIVVGTFFILAIVKLVKAFR